MVLPATRETIFFAGDTGPSGTTVQYRLIFDSETAILENIMAALRFLIDAGNWNANSQIQLDAYLNSLTATVESFEPMDTVGTIAWFAGDPASIPVGSLLCDGTAYARVDFPLLFAAIGTTWGAPTASEFNVPDLRGRSPVGSGTGPGLSSRFVGQTFGEEQHQLTVAELASHTHSQNNSILLGTVTPPPLDALGPNPLPSFTGSTGGNQPHNNMQPSGVLVPIIWTL
jgi:microcystin-dependent protein